METPFTVGRFDDSGPKRSFRSMRAALRYLKTEVTINGEVASLKGYYLVDRFGRKWPLPDPDLCRVCGQYDMEGACEHKRLSDKDAHAVGAFTKKGRGRVHRSSVRGTGKVRLLRGRPDLA